MGRDAGTLDGAPRASAFRAKLSHVASEVVFIIEGLLGEDEGSGRILDTFSEHGMTTMKANHEESGSLIVSR